MPKKYFEAYYCAAPGPTDYLLIHLIGGTHIIPNESIRQFAKDSGLYERDLNQMLTTADWVGFDIEGTIRSSTNNTPPRT